MIEQLQHMKSYARNEELFESVDDIIIEVKEKMNDLKLCIISHDNDTEEHLSHGFS